MTSEIAFRLREMQRFLVAVLTSQEGRKFLLSHLLNSLVLAVLVLSALSLVLFGLFEGRLLGRRTLVLALGMLLTLLVVVPMATMPFFSFKDVLNRLVGFFNQRGLFMHLSDHVFYRKTMSGTISLHLAKAHSILGEKHRLLVQPVKEPQNISRQLSFSLGRSIREAVRLSKQLVSSGRLKTDQKIVGATYGFLFGAAKSKLKLKRREPSWFSRWFGGVFYRFGAMHAVFMYFVIHDKLPPSFDPVYFIATVGEVVGDKTA